MAPRATLMMLFAALFAMVFVSSALAAETQSREERLADLKHRSLKLFDADGGLATEGIFGSLLDVVAEAEFLPGGIFGDAIALLLPFLAPLGGILENGLELLLAPLVDVLNLGAISG